MTQIIEGGETVFTQAADGPVGLGQGRLVLPVGVVVVERTVCQDLETKLALLLQIEPGHICP